MPGFDIRGEIRQGCPVSPLIFAICGDLLRRLSHELPQDLLRAYADDLALVSLDIKKSAPHCSRLFGEFAAISGLYLNLANTVFVPLGDMGCENLRRDLGQLCPGLGCRG
jgi:hypothetical protein